MCGRTVARCHLVRAEPAAHRRFERSMKALGELRLYVRIGEFVAHVPFLVVTNFAVDCILGTTFLDRHVKAILPAQKTVLFHHAPSVALTGVTPSRQESKMASRKLSQQLPQEENSADRKRAQFQTNVPSRKIRVVKGVTIPPMTQAMIRVATPVGGLCFLQNHPKTARKDLCLMAQGVMDLFLGEPFTVLVGNFGHRAVHVPKHTVVRLALPYPTHLLTIGVSAPGEDDAKEGEGTKTIPRPLRGNKPKAKNPPRTKAELIPQLQRNTRYVKDPLRAMAEEKPPPLREDTHDAKNWIRRTPAVAISLTQMCGPIQTRRRR